MSREHIYIFDDNEHEIIDRDEATTSQLLDALFLLVKELNLVLVKERYGCQQTILVRRADLREKSNNE